MVEGRRHIFIDKELLVYKNEPEVLEIVGDIVRNHYLASKGKVLIWGQIHNYVYHHIDGRKFTFDIDGTLSQNQGEIMESRAELKIGNQQMYFTIKEKI